MNLDLLRSLDDSNDSAAVLMLPDHCGVFVVPDSLLQGPLDVLVLSSHLRLDQPSDQHIVGNYLGSLLDDAILVQLAHHFCRGLVGPSEVSPQLPVYNYVGEHLRFFDVEMGGHQLLGGSLRDDGPVLKVVALVRQIPDAKIRTQR